MFTVFAPTLIIEARQRFCLSKSYALHMLCGGLKLQKLERRWRLEVQSKLSGMQHVYEYTFKRG